MFTPTELQSAIQQTLNDANGVITPAHKGAFFVAPTTEGVKGVLALKVNDTWTLNVYGEHGWTDHSNEAGVQLKAVW